MGGAISVLPAKEWLPCIWRTAARAGRTRALRRMPLQMFDVLEFSWVWSFGWSFPFLHRNISTDMPCDPFSIDGNGRLDENPGPGRMIAESAVINQVVTHRLSAKSLFAKTDYFRVRGLLATLGMFPDAGQNASEWCCMFGREGNFTPCQAPTSETF